MKNKMQDELWDWFFVLYGIILYLGVTSIICWGLGNGRWK